MMCWDGSGCCSAEELNLIDKTAWKPLWVTEFPLLDYSPEEKRYIFMHNPFAAPMDEDLPLPRYGAVEGTGEGL